MSLVFAAVCPHPPLLIPAIGEGKGMEYLKKTKAGFETLEQELYLSKPNLIVIISPHEGIYEDVFVVNAHTEFVSDYTNFGDVVTKDTWIGEPSIAAKISHAGHENESSLPVRLMSETKLSHGTAIPLHFLTAHLPEVKILPIGFSNRSREDHKNFGIFLKDILMNTDKRVAVIASGDLAHCLTKDAPAGLDEQGSTFDREIIAALEAGDTDKILSIDQEKIDRAKECGYRSLLILLGILDDNKHEFKKISYEYPFGVGYLVGNFVF